MAIGSMLIPIAALMMMKQFNFDDPYNLTALRAMFYAVHVGILLVHWLMYQRATAKNDERIITVPPAMGRTEPQQMTVCEYDVAAVKKAAQGLVTGVLISSLLHFKWSFIPPLFIQCFTQPFQLWDSPLFRIWMLGHTDPSLERPWPEPKSPLANLFGGGGGDSTDAGAQGEDHGEGGEIEVDGAPESGDGADAVGDMLSEAMDSEVDGQGDDGVVDAGSGVRHRHNAGVVDDDEGDDDYRGTNIEDID